MAPVRISSGPEPIMTLDLSSSSLVLYLMMFGQNSSSLVLHQMMSTQISSGLAPQGLKMFELSSSSLGFSNVTKASDGNSSGPLFWNTLTHDAKTRVYSFQVNKHWLTLTILKLKIAIAREVQCYSKQELLSESDPEPTQTKTFWECRHNESTPGKKENSKNMLELEAQMKELGFPDEEKLILEWEADVDSEHFDKDDNAGDDNEETKA
ncbi:hypothetical protein Tco_1441744 [Tanacetum coccineum]